MNRKKYDKDLALKLYQELGTYSAVGRELGCCTETAAQLVRQAKGLCTKCNNLPLPGHTLCKKHLEQNNANSRATRIKREKMGICQRCGKKLDRKGVVCSSCAKDISAASLARGKEKVKNGLCYRCSQPLGTRSAWYCDSCIDKVAEETKSRRSRLKSSGICTVCGKNPPSGENSLLCLSCREKHLTRGRLATGISEYAVNWQSVMEEHDYTCYLCGQPADTAHHIDESHYTDEPNHDVDNLVPLCKACHAGVTSVLALARRSDIVKVLNLVRQSPTNDIAEIEYIRR